MIYKNLTEVKVLNNNFYKFRQSENSTLLTLWSFQRMHLHDTILPAEKPIFKQLSIPIPKCTLAPSQAADTAVHQLCYESPR